MKNQIRKKKSKIKYIKNKVKKANKVSKVNKKKD